MTLDEYFEGRQDSRQLFETLRETINTLGETRLRVTKSQIAFYHRKAFAWAWIPGIYLHNRPTAPLVLTVAMRRRDPSPRWKEIVEPYPGRFTHHLELYSPAQIDPEVRTWLREAWAQAG